ncbi:hypothetical protein ACFX5U_14255 [Sphingobacterium sp. SG20118]|uniref:hypothetical protein n=1 Tax=Sphingobacterium TaxID=28453 RepID=UPI0004F68627|nr:MULTISPECIES: hypothetical protein [Sphingobacterium]AIM37927.1 hypothetical protein KO02_15450 [Sphingobacterium sp. ML3W]MDH5826016.1 hypothetical protein [Sphingobacterium faecium]
MNFDEFKEKWNNQSENSFEVNSSLNHYKSVGNILARLRKNIKIEFISWLCAIIFLLVLPNIEIYKITGYAKVAYYFLLLQMGLASLLYYKKFFYFYRSTKQFELLSSRENLLKLYYDLKFSIETYKMSSYLLFPQGILICFIFFSLGHAGEWLDKIYNLGETWNQEPSFIVLLILGLVIGLVFLVICIETMSYYYYGKYLKMIKDNMDALEEE